MSFIPEKLPPVGRTRNFEPPPEVKSEITNAFMEKILEVVTNPSYLKEFQGLSNRCVDEIKRSNITAYKRRVSKNPKEEANIIKGIFEKSQSDSKNLIRQELTAKCKGLIDRRISTFLDKYWFIDNKELKDEMINIICNKLIESFFGGSEKKISSAEIQKEVANAVSDFFHRPQQSS